MEYVIWKNGDTNMVTLTTNSPQSHYGIPVLRMELLDCPDLGPRDNIPFPDGAIKVFDDEDQNKITAADVVFLWGYHKERTKEERAAARLFLSQDPEGLQLMPEKIFIEQGYYNHNDEVIYL